MTPQISTTPLLLQLEAKTAIVSRIPFPHPETHPDVIWVNPEQEPLVIETIRQLQLDVLSQPYQEEYRIFILQNLELATIEAQQALLKLLEEPPKHVRFLLTSEYPSMILPTILSRVELSSKYQVLSIKGNTSARTPQTVSENLQAKQAFPDSIHESSNSVEPSSSLPKTLDLTDRLQWAEEMSKSETPMTTTIRLLATQLRNIENSPTLQGINQLRSINQALKFLQAKTNPKLCFEWLALHL